jgi:nickel/cobalt transporter (NicO) family protein
VDFLTNQFSAGSAWLLVATVLIVGVLHTIAPDHWVPITLIARQRGWSKKETARVALQAGIGHVITTLVLAGIVWVAGVAVASQFGHVIDSISSVALVTFGLWIAISSWREIRSGEGHGHSHDFLHLDQGHGATGQIPGIHGPELQQIPVKDGELLLSIYEFGQPPRFRLTANGAVAFDSVSVETLRPEGQKEIFFFANRGEYWESTKDIPQPHGFKVVVHIEREGLSDAFRAEFEEHEHGQEGHGGHRHEHEHGAHGHGSEGPETDKLYAPLKLHGEVATTHIHAHKHGTTSAPHRHWHDHSEASKHAVSVALEMAPPLHTHRHKTTARTALLLILGSSPMIEGIPAFFAAARFGFGLLIVMAVVFGLSTILTYVLLCVYSTAGLQRVKLGAIEKYGEVLSGAFIALVGVVFWLFPVL